MASRKPASKSADGLLRFNMAMQRSRIAVYSVALPLALVFTRSGFHQVTPLGASLLWMAACINALLFMGLYRFAVDRRLGISLRPYWMLSDVVFVSVVVYLDGGEHSLWFILYLAGVAGAAFSSGRRAAYGAMISCAVAYLGLLWMMGQISSFDQHLVHAVARLAVLFGASFFSIRGIADLQAKRTLIKKLRADDLKKVKALTKLTEELDERSRQLEEKNVLVEEANRLKTTFMANMSHELRTPLNSIIGFTQILQKKLDPAMSDQDRKFIGNVLTSGKHLLGLINDLLDLQKIEAGKMEVFPETIDVEDICASVVDLMAAEAGSRDLKLRLEMEAELPEVVSDRGKLEQILLNLLSNAVKFSAEGSEVVLRARQAAQDEGAGVLLEVIDQGPGIAEQDQEEIFEEFRQVHDGEPKPGGTGLGLALARRLLQLLGGSIAVRSTIGAGATFRVWVPLRMPARSAAGAQQTAVLDRPNEKRAAVSISCQRVLVVEDDANAAQLLAHTLEEAGYEAQTAGSGEEALDLVARDPPDLITLDLMLPGVDGWEVLRKLKAHPVSRPIPVVIVSVVDNRELAVALGADDFFVKPARHDELVQRLRQLAEPGAEQGSRKVLVIDDDPAVHQILGQGFGDLDLELLRADDGARGLAMARDISPDVIVLDLRLPDISGFEVAALLRDDPHTDAIPVVVTTALDLDAAERESLRGSIVALHRKEPPWPKELVATVQELLSRRS